MPTKDFGGCKADFLTDFCVRNLFNINYLRLFELTPIPRFHRGEIVRLVKSQANAALTPDACERRREGYRARPLSTALNIPPYVARLKSGKNRAKTGKNGLKAGGYW